MDEREGEEIALAGRAIVPVDHVDFEIDDSEECRQHLTEVCAEYRSLLQRTEDFVTKEK